MIKYADLPRCKCGRLYETCAIYDPGGCQFQPTPENRWAGPEVAAPMTEEQTEYMGALWRSVEKNRPAQVRTYAHDWRERPERVRRK